MTIDFFISYNKAYATWAEWIAWVLEENGKTVVIQAWDFRPGGNFVLDIQSATQACDRIPGPHLTCGALRQLFELISTASCIGSSRAA